MYRHSSVNLCQGVDVTPVLLEYKTFTSSELVTGRTLLDRSMFGLRNCKKAASMVEKYVDKNSQPKFS